MCIRDRPTSQRAGKISENQIYLDRELAWAAWFQLRREGQRLTKLAVAAAVAQAQAADYEGEDERAFVQGIATLVSLQAQRLTQLVADAARWKDEYL